VLSGSESSSILNRQSPDVEAGMVSRMRQMHWYDLGLARHQDSAVRVGPLNPAKLTRVDLLSHWCLTHGATLEGVCVSVSAMFLDISW
jgi:hypothetical protein